MGEVYRARDPRLGRDVAIKVLPPGLAADSERLRRFAQEARAAAALNHPNILAVYDIGQHDGSPYIVSELLEGDTLRGRLIAGVLPLRKAVEHAVQIAHGLAAAHEKGIIHRDLKPENIFISLDGNVKILDFGLAKLTQADTAVADASGLPTATANTETGTVLGTMGYMSPEQVRGVVADHRSDVFSFGAILYEMLSGRRAFHGDTAADTITAILKEDPPDQPVADRHIPPALVRIVDRCLEKNASRRFQSASDLGFALDGLSSQSEKIAAPVAAARTGVRRRQIAWTSFGVALAAALVLSAVTYVKRSAPDAPALKATILPPPGTTITDRSAAQGGVPARRLALSPDGQRIAFTSAGPDRVIWLWVQRLDALTANRIEGSEGAVYPFWSPDSRVIAFFSENGVRRSKLMTIDASGGPLVTVCELPGPNSTGGSWNQDGVILYGTFGSPEGRIHRVSASGGTPSPVTTIDTASGETRHYSPSFLPDGRHFLYLAVGVKGGNPFQPNGLYVGSLDSNERRLLMPGGSTARYANGQLLFLRGSTLLMQPFDPVSLELRDQAVRVAEDVLIGGPTGAAGAVTVSENGRLAYQTGSPSLSRLTWFDRAGKQLGVLGEPGLEGDLALSPDGSRVAVTAENFTSDVADLWVYDVARAVRTRLTFDTTKWNLGPVWSPDGQRIAFSSNRKDPSDLYVKPASGPGAEELLFAGGDAEAVVSWSPDGRFLAYVSYEARAVSQLSMTSPQVPADLWILPLFGDRKPFPFAQTPFRETQARFAPDGRWLAYVSNESGRSEVYVAPFPGPGGKVAISTAGGTQPRWRRDGTEFFYIASRNRLMVAAVNGQRATFEVGAVRPLFELHPRIGLGNAYDVSADGQRFLVNTLVEESTSAPITLVVNWPALLKK